MLVADSTNNSRQSLRSILKGILSHSMAITSTGMPSHMDKVRNNKGGIPVTPSFITGQFKPHTKVNEINNHNCFALSFCIA